MALEIEQLRGAWLRLPCCIDAVHPVKIESHNDGHMVISAPREPHETWVERPEEPTSVVLGWSDDDGSTIILECRLSPEEQMRAEPGDSWTLEVLAANNYAQRRRHHRVQTHVNGHLLDVVGGDPVAVKLVDISEAGMRCSFTDFTPDDKGEPMRFAIKIDGSILILLATLRWSDRVGPIEIHAGFEFREMHEHSQTYLRSHVMQQLARS